MRYDQDTGILTVALLSGYVGRPLPSGNASSPARDEEPRRVQNRAQSASALPASVDMAVGASVCYISVFIR